MKFVKIPDRDFEMSDYQIIQSEWEIEMGSNPSRFNGPSNPVENISWNDCQEFIKKLNAKQDDFVYRLPTEEEWEYCCRAGSIAEYCFGNDENELGDYAWYYDNSNKTTHPVRQKKPNAWGLYDMHGNVWEWTASFWDKTDTSSGSNRVLRGGSWLGGARYLRSANRGYDAPVNRDGDLGARLVRTACNPQPSSPFTLGQKEILWRAFRSEAIAKAKREFEKSWRRLK